MTINIVEIHYLGQIYSPFSGLPADGEDGPNENDPTLLFVHYGDAGQYAYAAPRINEHVEIDDSEPGVDELAENLAIDGGMIIQANCDWNGINTYGFAPAD